MREMRDLICFSAHWTDDVKAAMRYTVAAALKRSPLDLPPMSRDQLWASYKTARPLVELPAALDQALSYGERVALEYGVMFHNATFPEGDDSRAIMLSLTAVRELLIRTGVLDPNDPTAEPDQAGLEMLAKIARGGLPNEATDKGDNDSQEWEPAEDEPQGPDGGGRIVDMTDQYEGPGFIIVGGKPTQPPRPKAQ